jgi:hypothetical protein
MSGTFPDMRSVYQNEQFIISFKFLNQLILKLLLKSCIQGMRFEMNFTSIDLKFINLNAENIRAMKNSDSKKSEMRKDAGYRNTIIPSIFILILAVFMIRCEKNVVIDSFTPEGTVSGTDDTPPTVLSTAPANNSASVPETASVNATFSEAMNEATFTASTFILNQGTTSVTGIVTSSGSTATFKPAAPLADNTLYTATITSGVKDAAGNALTSNYTWSFTTAVGADVTAPTVLSVVPVGNATLVPLNSSATATFSEDMNQATLTASTFTLKEGTTAITGTVTYAGTTATFEPSAALAGNTVYTAKITTDVKDAAGNKLAGNYTWSFTTVAAVPTGLSFANDVVPVLNLCNDCHKHPWTTSSVASTFYTNLVNGGYVDPISPKTSKIYVKLNSGHPGSGVSTSDKNKVLTWISEGSKNN